MSGAAGGSSARVPATGWFVEVDYIPDDEPDAEPYTHRPTVMDEPAPQRNPVANDFPTVQIPVRKNAKWSDERLEDAPMRVWKDGERQEVDTLQAVEQTERATVLRGRGGQELDRRYQGEITQQQTTDFVENVVADITGYEPHVDEPPTTREDDVDLYQATRDGDFESRLSIDPTDPVVVEDGAVKLRQTCYPQDGIDGVRNFGSAGVAPAVATDDRYNSGFAIIFDDDGETLRFEFETEHDIPAKHVGLKVRSRCPDSTSVAVNWNGSLLARVGNPDDLDWDELGERFEAIASGPIRAGERNELEFVAESSLGDYRLDVVALYDRRYSYSWPNPGGGNNGGALSGPELYPDVHNVRFDEFLPPRAVVGGRLDVSTRGGVGRIGLSNTQREDYGIVTDDTIYEVDFADPGPSLAPLVTLGRYGDDPDRDTIPTQGYRGQHLTSMTLTADLEDVPLVVNQSFDGQLVDILSSVAENTNAIFEYRREGDVESVEWTQPGQRTVGRTPDVSDFSTVKSTAKRVEKAAVYGGNRDITNEYRFLPDLGSPINLKHDRIKQGTVRVVGAASGIEMTRGDDYTVRHDDGEIVPQSDGRMDGGDGFDISYTFETYGEYTLPGVDDPVETVEEATGLVSDFACQQAARAIVDELDEPIHRGTVTVSGDEHGFSIVDALAGADLPGNVGSGIGGIQVKEVEHEPGEARLRIGSRRSVNEIVTDLERNVSAVAREV
ncbi:hypothetical protein [Halococcus sp. PRR34]|uniref:hypothetical protein n=1 Tax=Halococcus sp. PRR34 TaxID=3020830 RepID=UPI0023627D98|nr:hypothetical protein [Halococcus sp. PRR34]